MFSPFHYMTAELHKAAQCFGLWVGDELTSFVALLHNPISAIGEHVPIWRVSRVVTLPDWQGMGLAFQLIDRIGAELSTIGCRLRNYPAHPSFVRAHAKSGNWREVKKSGRFQSRNTAGTAGTGQMGGRPNGIFEYQGPPAEVRALREFAARRETVRARRALQHPLRGHRGIDPSRTQRIDRDSTFGQLERQRAREADDAMLGRTVRGVARHTEPSEDG
jgi:GNAT superfamily N-acetyltransferase